MSDQILFEKIHPERGSGKVFAPPVELEYTPGDIVSTPRGVGVVGAGLIRDFEFPVTGGGVTDVQASEETPAYIVGFGGRSAPYRASALEQGDLYNPQATDGNPAALARPVFEETFIDREAMRENWGKRDLLSWWSSAGGLWSRAKEYLMEERDISEDTAEGIVSKRKDIVLGTDRWRTRF